MERRAVSKVFSNPKTAVSLLPEVDPMEVLSDFDRPDMLIARQTPAGHFQILLRSQLENYIRREETTMQVLRERGVDFAKPETFAVRGEEFALELRAEVDRRLAESQGNQGQ